MSKGAHRAVDQAPELAKCALVWIMYGNSRTECDYEQKQA